jgi:hypothetical protein
MGYRSILLGVVALLFLAVVSNHHAQAQTQPSDSAEEQAKRADIRRVLEMSGAGKVGVQIMAQMIVQFQKAFPNVPQSFWNDFLKGVNADELNDLAIESYDKHFTHDDIRQLIEFYNSPIGRKMTAELPSISKECMAAGQKWGRARGEEIMQRLREKGYVKQS